MKNSITAPLGHFVTFQRGFDITRDAQIDGTVPVVSSGGVSSTHNVASANGPGVVIGRKGTLGKVFYMPDDYWPHDTTLWVKEFNENHPRFVYYFMKTVDVSWLDAGSANPTLNRNHLHPLVVTWPIPAQQRAIAEVLGALDDKIAANSKLAESAESLAQFIFDSEAGSRASVAMSEIVTPILGGTPPRSREDFWIGSRLWISARDVTGAANSVVIDTDEHISDSAVQDTKAKPLRIGSVILTARGTVGAVARLGAPASFNQSCYGFEPGAVPASILYFGTRAATEKAKAIAHGSVFDTITKKTFEHLPFPKLSPVETDGLEARLAPLLDAVTGAVRESRTLAATRDALLPYLMSGRLTVRDAEKTVEDLV